MSAIRTDELMARIAAYEEGPFPQKDHFHATLAPWKDRLDEKRSLRADPQPCARATGGARDWWPRRWAGWLAPPAALLVPVMLDPGAPLHQRAAAAAAIQEYSPGTTHTLSPDERGRVAGASGTRDGHRGW